MAKTITREDMVFASFPIRKWTEEDNGDLIIYGKATDGTIDADRQIVDPAWSGPALEKWLATKGNVRVQHSPHLYPAGKGISVEVDRDGDGGHWVKSRIVEPTAKKLVKAGVLQDYSIGIAHPLVIRDATGKAAGGIVTGNDDTEVAELSIVDRGSNRNSGFTLAKSAGNDVPWTYGDLDELLKRAESATKAADDDEDGDEPTYTDPTDAGDPDDDSAPGAGDEDDRPEDDDDDESVKAYQAAVRAHKAAEPKRDGVPLTGTEFLVKAAAWQKWSAAGEDDGLDGTPAGFARWVAKRDMDPDVGGGVDRDKLPTADFVDPTGRRFPIAAPGDVSDAVSSYGRAKPLIPMKQFRKRLTAIAERKGPAFVAQLPASWSGKSAATKDITLSSPDPDGFVPYNLATGPSKRVKDDEATADMTKGAKTCPQCGHSYDADSKRRRCESCGRKLPKGDMGPVTKNNKGLPPDVKPAGEHREPDGSAVEALEHDAGMHTDPDAEQDRIPASVKRKKKTRKPAFPGAAKPFGSDDDTDAATKSAGYTVQRMHDAVCAAYHWDDVTGTYPALKSVGDALDPAWFERAAADALAKGDLTGVQSLAACAQSAQVLAKGHMEPAIVADARAGVHKSFADMYPTVHVHPGTITPGQFQRPYISAGHAPLNASHGVTPAIPPASHVISPGQFDRPLITAGHEAESPSDRGGNNPTASVATGSSRALYGAAAKAAAENAMKAMHDHLAAGYPDVCPMAPSRAVLPPDNHAHARPAPTVPLAVPPAPGEKAAHPTWPTTTLEVAADDRVVKAAKAARKAAKQARNAAKSAAVNGADLADIITKAVDARWAATVATYEDTITGLRAEIDELGAQPDPAQAPLRGAVRTAPPPTVVDKAQDTPAAPEADADALAFARLMAKSSDPRMQQIGEDQIRALLTKQS